MTLDTRARQASQGIHRAVEVMEMSTFTKEPKKVERFDRYRDRKQRNRRIGAILVAGALVVAAVVLVSTDILDRGEGTTPGIPPALSPPAGSILFGVEQGDGTQALFTADVAGGPERDLGIATDPGATWSPDGATILVTSSVGPAETRSPLRPATIDPDGSNFTLLGATSDPEVGLNCLTWSPDGSQLACEGFSTSGGPELGGVYTVRASDGGGIQRLTEFRAVPMDYSPDGSQIVLFRGDQDPESPAGALYVVNADGTGLRRITPAGFAFDYFASWSPDGERIAFGHFDDANGGELYVVAPDGSGLTEFLTDEMLGMDAWLATWSPDGAHIAFLGWQGGDEPDVFIARADGTDVQQVTDTPDVFERNLVWGPPRG
jgi:Tol biopolymer transport system component